MITRQLLLIADDGTVRMYGPDFNGRAKLTYYVESCRSGDWQGCEFYGEGEAATFFHELAAQEVEA